MSIKSSEIQRQQYIRTLYLWINTLSILRVMCMRTKSFSLLPKKRFTYFFRTNTKFSGWKTHQIKVGSVAYTKKCKIFCTTLWQSNVHCILQGLVNNRFCPSTLVHELYVSNQHAIRFPWIFFCQIFSVWHYLVWSKSTRKLIQKKVYKDFLGKASKKKGKLSTIWG